MSRPWAEYELVVIESYYEVKSGKRTRIHCRPVEGQGYSTSMDVECSRKMRDTHPIGTRFRVRAKLTDREGGKPFLYTNWRWDYEVVTDEEWVREGSGSSSSHQDSAGEDVAGSSHHVPNEPAAGSFVDDGSVLSPEPEVIWDLEGTPDTPGQPDSISGQAGEVAKLLASDPVSHAHTQSIGRRRSCFPGHARVLTPLGYQAISALRVGSCVVAYRPDGTFCIQPVTRVCTHAGAATLRLLFGNGHRLEATGNHCILTSRGWMRIHTLRPGVLVVGRSGLLSLVGIEEGSDTSTVFNLHVKGDSTFVVGGCVVHCFATFRSFREALHRIVDKVSRWSLLTSRAANRSLDIP